MKKKRGIFTGRQQTPPAIPPTQISDAKLLADLDVEIAAAERAANPPEGSTAVINALSPGLAAMMPTATKQARKKLLTLQQVRKRLAELIEKEYQLLGGPRRDNAPGGYDDDYPFPDEE